jgi:hypothetical protein
MSILIVLLTICGPSALALLALWVLCVALRNLD